MWLKFDTEKKLWNELLFVVNLCVTILKENKKLYKIAKTLEKAFKFSLEQLKNKIIYVWAFCEKFGKI